MVENLLVAIIAGLFGLLPVAFQWLSERSRVRSRQTRIQRLAAELECLTAWQKSATSVAPDDMPTTVAKRMRAYLDRLAENYERLPRSDHNAPHRPVSLWRRAFLLFAPATNLAWLAHSLFYFLLPAGIAVVFTEEPSLSYDVETGSNEFADVLLGTLVIFGSVLLALQRWAMHLPRHAVAHDIDPSVADTTRAKPD